MAYEEIEPRGKIVDTESIEKTIQANKDFATSYEQLAILTRLINNNEEDIIDVPYDNALYMYLDELKNASMKVKLTDSELERYQYRPDLLSYDLYGTSQYDYIILALNDIISPKYFDRQTVRIVDSEYISELISTIADSESEYIELNRSTYTSE